jgi:hypothetical protein
MSNLAHRISMHRIRTPTMRRGRKNTVTDISLRDAQGDQEVAAILAELPEKHPAREAFVEGRPTMEIVRLVRDKPEVARKLMLSYWDCHRRSLVNGNGN